MIISKHANVEKRIGGRDGKSTSINTNLWGAVYTIE